jgi:SAM-dependent methyltransferase
MSDGEPLFIHELEAVNNPAARILDLGAGSGSFDYEGRRATIVALDRKAPAQAPSGNASFIQADAAWLPFSSGVFDVVACNFVFEHFARPELVLREVERITRPGALLYLSIPNSRSLEDRIFGLLSRGKDHVSGFTFHSLTRLVYQNTSFKLQSFADWPAGFTWLTPDPIGSAPRRWTHQLLRSLRPYLQGYSATDSGYVFLFRREGRRGFRKVAFVCCQCGSGSEIACEHKATEWICRRCGRRNSYPRRLW